VIDFSIEVRGLQETMDSFKQFRRRVPGTVLNAVRRPLRRRVTKVRQGIRRESGIGRSIWGKKGNAIDLAKIVKLIKAKVAGAQLVTGISLKGFPALIEEGGQVKPHAIKNAFGQGKVAKHRGMTVRPHGIAKRVLAGVGAEIVEAVRQDLDKLKAKVMFGSGKGL
jgi:hypothetical protein